MNAILIARVSTEEQKEAGNSLPAQLARLEKYCRNKGLEIIKEFSFDESVYTTERGEFDRIIDFVLAQTEKVAVCCDKVDRLSRNVFDKRISVLYEKALNDEVELHFISDGQVINSRISAAEKFQFNISLGLAKYYSDAISDNVTRATEQKLRKGEWPGKAPYGYKKILQQPIIGLVLSRPYITLCWRHAEPRAWSKLLCQNRSNNEVRPYGMYQCTLCIVSLKMLQLLQCNQG